MRRVFLFLAGASSLHLLQAQSGVTGPIEGFTFDAPTRSIRAVIGSLGSASLGGAAVNDLDFASVAPKQNYGIAFRRGQSLFISQLGSTSQVSVAALAQPFSVPDGVVWSGDGSAAVLYSRAGGWIQTFSGFPAAASPGPVINISSPGGSLSSIATDLHGQHVAAGVTGDNAGVYQSTNGQSFVPLLTIANPLALSFSEDGGTLYALDAVNQVSEINLTSFTTQTWPLGTEDAIAIKAARNASNLEVLYVAGATDRLLLAFDRSTHQPVASVPLSFAPAKIDILGNNSFLLRSRTGDSDPLWSFAGASQPMVYFVPATPLPKSSLTSRETSREVQPK